MSLAGQPGASARPALPLRRLAPASPSPCPGGPEVGSPAARSLPRHRPSGPQAHRGRTPLSVAARGAPSVANFPPPPSRGRGRRGDTSIPSRKVTSPALPPLLPAAIFLLPRRLLLTPWPAPPRCSRGTGAARREGSSRRVEGLGLDAPPSGAPRRPGLTQKQAGAARPVAGLTGSAEAQGLGCFSSGSDRES